MRGLRFFRYGKVYIIPTYNGMILLGLLMVTIVCATSTGNNLLYLFGILLGLFVLISMIRAHHNLGGLKVSDQSTQYASAKNTLSCMFNITNDRKERRFQIRVDIPKVKNKDSVDLVKDYHTIEEGQQSLNYTYSNLARGVYRRKHVKLTSRFPFGLWRVWMYLPCELELVIYPKPEGAVQPPKFSGQDLQGEDETTNGGDDFKELKKYSAGDSPYHIDWHSLARGRELQVKDFNAGGLPLYLIDYHSTPSMPVEKRLSLLSKWIFDCRRTNSPFRFKLNRFQLNSHSKTVSEEDSNKCLRILALHNGDQDVAS